VIAAPLLRWYRKNRRPLPWRRSKDPYRVWVSEIMLQQTQVAAVIPYYERFLRRFPTVRALARAPLQEVLKMWEGLGYYARARNLHRAARTIRKWPRTAQAWRLLPGVGPYTAAAIASICFGEPVPVWDGNVRRVLCRLLGRESTMPSDWIPRETPGDFNQALMELGQRICTPRRPDCPSCPLRRRCLARRRNMVDRLPPPNPSRRVPRLVIGLGIVRRNGRVLIGRRPESKMLGGLWEFPGGKRRPREPVPDCVRREVREETGFGVDVGPRLALVDHRYSHLEVRLHAYDCRVRSGALRDRRFRWVRRSDLARYPFPAANLRILEAIPWP
jgi:A/G-specific adenine glycosylase